MISMLLTIIIIGLVFLSLASLFVVGWMLGDVLLEYRADAAEARKEGMGNENQDLSANE